MKGGGTEPSHKATRYATDTRTPPSPSSNNERGREKIKRPKKKRRRLLTPSPFIVPQLKSQQRKQAHTVHKKIHTTIPKPKPRNKLRASSRKRAVSSHEETRETYEESAGPAPRAAPPRPRYTPAGALPPGQNKTKKITRIREIKKTQINNIGHA